MSNEVKRAFEKSEPSKESVERMYNNIKTKTSLSLNKKQPSIFFAVFRVALPVLACVCLAVAVVYARSNNSPITVSDELKVTNNKEADKSVPDVGAVNPIENVEDISAFEKLGIFFNLPDTSTVNSCSIIDGDIAEVNFVYSDKEYTLSASAVKKDISGIYGNTESSAIDKMAELRITDTGEDLYYIVEWTDKEVNYCLTGEDDSVKTLYEAIK